MVTKIANENFSGPQMLGQCELVSKLFKTLSNPHRLKVLFLLSGGEKSVGDLEKLTQISQSQISQFLKRMEYEQLVTNRRDGKYIYYKLNDPKLLKLFETLGALYCNMKN